MVLLSDALSWVKSWLQRKVCRVGGWSGSEPDAFQKGKLRPRQKEERAGRDRSRDNLPQTWIAQILSKGNCFVGDSQSFFSRRGKLL